VAVPPKTRVRACSHAAYTRVLHLLHEHSLAIGLHPQRGRGTIHARAPSLCMNSRIVTILAIAALALGACGRPDDNSQGNGPGHADGFGGRHDPPAASQESAAAEESSHGGSGGTSSSAASGTSEPPPRSNTDQAPTDRESNSSSNVFGSDSSKNSIGEETNRASSRSRPAEDTQENQPGDH
jgi:hypothetical protein